MAVESLASNPTVVSSYTSGPDAPPHKCEVSGKRHDPTVTSRGACEQPQQWFPPIRLLVWTRRAASSAGCRQQTMGDKEEAAS